MRRIYVLNGLNIEERLRDLNFKELFIKRNSLKFHYLITKILFRYYRKSNSTDGYVKINSTQLRKELGQFDTKYTIWKDRINRKKDHLYMLIRHLLYEWGVIQFKTNSPDGEKSYCYYKILDEWYDKGWTKYEGEIPDKLSKAFEDYDYENKPELSDLHLSLKENYEKVKLDKKEATEWLIKSYYNKTSLRDKANKYGNVWKKRVMNERYFSIYKMYIDNFDDDKYFFVSSKTGRIFTSITNLPKLLRQFLSLDGKTLREYDVSNSQPFLLNYLMKDVGICPKYYGLTRNGEFYKYLKAVCERNGVTVSSNFKTDFIAKTFYSKPTTNHPITKIFKQEFPEVYDFIISQKTASYKDLAIKLQKLEVDKVINGACEKIKKFTGPCPVNLITIHDAILTTNNIELVKSTVKEYYYQELDQIMSYPEAA